MQNHIKCALVLAAMGALSIALVMCFSSHFYILAGLVIGLIILGAIEIEKILGDT